MALKEYTDKYVHAVKHQPHTLQRVLDVFHMLAYLAPPGMGNLGEIATELTSAVTSVLGDVNQHILAAPSSAAPHYPKRPHGSGLLPGVPVDACRWALTALGHFDVVLELSFAGAVGENARLNLITILELLRSALKLAVLLGSGDRMLVLGGRAHMDTVTSAIAASRAKAAALAATARSKTPAPASATESHEGDADPTCALPSSEDEPPPADGLPPAAAAPSPPNLTPTTTAGADGSETAPPSTPEAPPLPPSFDPTPVGTFVPPVWWKGQRTGLRGMVAPVLAKVSSEATAAAVAEGLASGRGATAVQSPPGFASMAYTQRVETTALLGELLHIMRPLVAALTMRLQGRRGGWAPLLLSAAMDAASWQLSECAAIEGGAADNQPAAPSLLDALTGRGAFKHISLRSATAGGAAAGTEAGSAAPTEDGPMSKVFDSGMAALALRLVWWASSAAMGASAAAGTGRCLTPEEEDELVRRKRAWALYLLHSPVFERATMPAASRVVDAASFVPIMGWVVQFAVGMLGYYNKVHFYSSGSS